MVTRTSLVVQWLRFHVSTAGSTGLILVRGTKIPHGAQCRQKPKVCVYVCVYIYIYTYGASLVTHDSKESACNTRDPGSVPGLGRSIGEGHDNPVQNPMDRGAWWATVLGGRKESDTIERLILLVMYIQENKIVSSLELCLF